MRWNKKERVKTYDVQLVLDKYINYDTKSCLIKVGNFITKCKHIKYDVFRKSILCANCKLKGTFFALERDINNNMKDIYCFNLYGIKKGKEVIFTIDHIKPKSKGGINKLENYQTMCYDCNTKKGSRYEN